MTEDEGLLSESELREAMALSAEILAQPVKEYRYNDPSYKGGPRNTDVETLTAAGIELTAIRMVFESIQDELAEARIQLIEMCQEQIDQGVPVEFVARHSGYKHRASVYRAIESLPKLKERRDAARVLQARIRRAGT